MASDKEKNWNQPWSMEEIIENAENWSLAGDVALLNSIKAYAETLLTKTVSISNSVDDLLNNLDEVGLKLEISQNEFQSLHNTQFIESRVYEDDETVDIKENVKEEEKELSEDEKQKMIRDSILEGLQVMDKYYDKLEVSISDSEEESDKSYVLQLKDLYADRPLPLIIGTDEWYKKWHVGLAESSSESDSDKISETYSDSDSEDALPKDILKGSETSSELDYSSQANENRPVANSTFIDSAKQPDIFESDESDEPSSLPVKTPISNKNFADQLAEKLGNVISEREDISTEINTKPIKPAQSNKFVGDLFSDEPPPLDFLEDTVLPKNAQLGLFSGGQGLFSDNEEESFWDQTVPKVKVEEDKAIVKQEGASQGLIKNTTLLPKSFQVSKGLFDSDDSSDEGIFASNIKQLSKPPFLQPYKTVAPLFEDEPPELESELKITEEVAKKKPIGGVPVFETSNLFADQKIEDVIKSRQQNVTKEGQIVEGQPTQQDGFNIISSGKKVRPTNLNLFDDEVDSGTVTSPRKIENKIKKPSLFDYDDDLFKDDLFSNVTSKKPVLNLFDDDDRKFSKDTLATNDNIPKVDLFNNLGSTMTFNENKADIKPNVKNPDKIKKVISLFSDNEDDDIFEHKLKMPRNSDNTNKIVSNDVVLENEEQNQNINKTSEDLPERQVIGIDEKSQQMGTAKVLDKYQNKDESDILFEAENVKKGADEPDVMEHFPTFDTGLERDIDITPPKTDSELVPQPPQLQVTNPAPAISITKKPEDKTISLFGSSPPPDDDDWDTKSDNLSDTEDNFSYRIDSNFGRSSLFDNEPPSLGPNESSGIVRDQNATRVASDDSSLYPYASSSRRLSSDIFNEQQSQDSFFITKNRMESVNILSHLDIIEEDRKSSNLSITASGRLEELEDSSENSIHSVFTHNSPETKNVHKNPKKPLAFLGDDDEDDEDLFSFKPETKPVPRLSEKRLTLFGNVNDILEAKKVEPDCLSFESETSLNPKRLEESEGGDGILPDYGNIKIEAENSSQQPQSNLDKETPRSGSFGKLKHSLNINVNALLPGSAPPKFKDLSKSQSLDLPKEDLAYPTSVSSSNINFLTPDVPKQPKTLSGTHLEKSVSFEDALDNVEVLHSVTKDRVRIPIKRRPSTRRGRQEAIRKTTTNVSVENDSNIDSIFKKPAETESKMEQNEPIVEADRVTKGSEIIPSEVEPILQSAYTGVEKEQQNHPSNNTTENYGLFSDLSEKSSKELQNNKSKYSIFDSGDSDNDLFGPSEVKKPKQKSKTKSKPTAKKKSLFNDSSSDDDLFSASSNNENKKREQLRPPEKKVQKSSTLRKLQNIETNEDPLSSLLK